MAKKPKSVPKPDYTPAGPPSQSTETGPKSEG
nr:MAG TPA: hypothetical protein [Caudoviricetes sp.]